ncbi:T9SS type A sorting domain-containing protein [Psychroflexus sp. CAK8W]|uniref:T9SS type A sorting domain-containing protein n=1 Tax=Psychroflexus longus TaxID=2873596 RepID=A0ABS7XID9_9FLAO|nr:T9SS type A sorting domain-containing protein [Psychroflexus longus]MBZ9777666.1 T9SS type A sorting domain-containing protein [Psychroflexus longus]
MKKITYLFLLMVIPFGIMAQELPLDFEVAEDDSFSGFNDATANVVEDPTDPTNQVLELTSAGNDFDGASINLATYVDLSDDSNNTITLRFWSPDATTRTHLLKFEGATNGPGAAELYFDTTIDGWQTITLDFPAGLANDYPTLVLFADAGVGNTATGTYYIDDIDGPNGDPVPEPIEDITVSAPDPTEANSDVLSIYNDTNNYTNIWVPEYSFGEASFVDISGNQTIKIDFSAAGWGQGREPSNLVDISQYDRVHFDYYVDDRFDPGSMGEQVLFILIDNDGGTNEYNYELTLGGSDGTLQVGSWVSVDVPLSFFENLGFDKSLFFQYKLGTTSDLYSKIVYFDNIYFSSDTPLSNNKFTQAEFKVYPNPSKGDWNIRTTETIKSVQVYNITGRLVREVNVNASEAVINTNGLSSGVYLAKVSNEFDQTKTIKLIKE